MNGYQISPSKSSKAGSFDPESFKRELNRASVSVETLQHHRKRIQSEADEISLKLKKNVFQNYSLFIDSAKEISLLKNEMYSLSKILTDQQGLLSSLTDVSISGDRTHGLTLTEKKEVAAKFKSGNDESDIVVRSRGSSNQNQNGGSTKALVEVIEKIDGGVGLLETRNRYLVHSGELTELDPNDYSLLNQGKVLAILANDCLILAHSYHKYTSDPRSRNDKRKYKFTSMIELDNIAVVNVKDVNYKSAFKVLMSSTTKVFDCESIESKKKWLDLFESAKKSRRQSLNFQRRDSMLFSQMQEMNPNKENNQSGFTTSQSGLSHHQSAMSLRGGGQHLSPSVDRFPSFDEEMEDLSESELVPGWLEEVPDDMDVFIAQRKFDDAVDLVHKVNDHITMYPKCFDGFFHNDLRLRINHKIQELIDSVSCDLKVSPDRIQSDHKAACHAVWRLRRLGKSVLATKLFLDQRTSLLKFSLKNQMKDGATIKYVENLSKVLVHNLITSGNDFKNAFMVVPLSRNHGLGGNHGSGSGAKSPSSSFPPAFPMSYFIRWSHQELSYFLNIFSKNVFTPQVPPSVSAQCVKILRDKVHVAKGPHPGIGLDLVFILDKSLKNDIERVIHDSSEKVIEAVKLRIKDDRWEGQDLKNKPALSKFLEEMKEVGLKSMEEYVQDEYKVSLTSGVTQFAKSYLNLTVDVLKLSTPFTSSAVIDALVKSFAAEMKYIEQVLRNLSRSGRDNSRDSSRDNRIGFVKKNAQFILDHVIRITLRMYEEKTGISLRQLEMEKEHFIQILNDSRRMSDENRILSDSRRMSDENRRHDERRTSNDHGQSRRVSHQGSSTSTPSSRSSSAITGNGNSSSKRSPSKSTISIGTDGKTVSTTTYL